MALGGLVLKINAEPFVIAVWRPNCHLIGEKVADEELHESQYSLQFGLDAEPGICYEL
jgi:hypothetical protein